MCVCEELFVALGLLLSMCFWYMSSRSRDTVGMLLRIRIQMTVGEWSM